MASDQVVISQDVLRAWMQLRRIGTDKTMQELETQEPDLTEFLLEELSAIQVELSGTGEIPRKVQKIYRRIEAMTLVLLLSLRGAHARLWREEAAGGRLSQIDPSLSERPSAPEPTQQSGDTAKPPEDDLGESETDG
jgi:hypothetical protein